METGSRLRVGATRRKLEIMSMVSLLSFFRMRWDPEPRRWVRCRDSVLDCGSPLPLLRPQTRSQSARGLAQSKTRRDFGWFVESLLSLFRMQWCQFVIVPAVFPVFEANGLGHVVYPADCSVSPLTPQSAPLHSACMTKPSASPVIRLRGVRHNNLKHFDLDLPLHQLIVFTGLSGSGKSSLAFDTLFAEGQRRYIETFSPYARQFFDRMDKPQVDSVEGIPPAIAI